MLKSSALEEKNRDLFTETSLKVAADILEGMSIM